MTKENDVEFGLTGLDTMTRANEGTWMPVLLPNGNQAVSPSGVPIELKLFGSDGVLFQEIVAEKSRAAMEAAQKTTGSSAADIRKKAQYDGADVLARLTAEWKGIEYPDSTKEAAKPIPLMIETARTLYLKYPMIRDQADRWINARVNFLLEPSKS